ncbi:MAG: transketolase family protein [Leptospiraceae bacterium]|nr:transketolase family protein [Leptospiraceae bacterium]
MEKKATRDAYGETLRELGRQHSSIVVLDADLSGSTKTNLFAKEFPDRFINVGVAEQNLVGMAAGFALSGLTAFASSFAMFLSGRAWEITRNSVAYPGLNVKLVATHGGITVGEDGASHQCIEDLAIMRAIPEMRVFIPADAPEMEQVIRKAYELQGPVYVRAGRSGVPVLAHASDYQFEPGKAEIRREGRDATIVACGIMVAEADQAAALLAAEHQLDVAVLNMASIKPFDTDTMVRFARQTGVVVSCEEHNIIGGLGSAVCECLAEHFPVPVKRMGMLDQFGQSGPAEELLDHYKLRASDIVSTVLEAVQKARES